VLAPAAKLQQGSFSRAILSLRTVSTAAFSLYMLAVLAAFASLAAHRREQKPSWLRGALLLVLLLAWGAYEASLRAPEGPWHGLLLRALSRSLSPPAPLFSFPVRSFFAVLAFFLAPVALLARKPTALVAGPFALLLLGAMEADVPLCSLSTAVASLALVLAAYDPQALAEPSSVSTVSKPLV
jgi:hypothetical protein